MPPRSRRRTNYELAHSIEVLLRRLTASGLTRDKTLAEDLIADLNGRLCPRPAPKHAAEPGMVSLRLSRRGNSNWRGK